MANQEKKICKNKLITYDKNIKKIYLSFEGLVVFELGKKIAKDKFITYGKLAKKSKK